MNEYKDTEIWRDEYDPGNKYIKVLSDSILAVGGDGTLLRAIQMHRKKNKPFYPIASGTVNFLMNQEDNWTKDSKNKNLQMIKIKVIMKDGQEKVFHAFNEILIGELAGWINFDCKHKDDILGNFKGAGLIFSTPQGTTGINKNNGGVILPLSSNNWSVTSMQTNKNINYVLNSKQKIMINTSARHPVKLLVDNQLVYQSEEPASFEITRGDKVQVIFNDYQSFKEKRR